MKQATCLVPVRHCCVYQVLSCLEAFVLVVSGQLADAQEQLQQQGTMQPNSPFSTSQPFSTSAPAAELAMMTKDNEALRQEVQRLQQEAAVKAEDTAAQQLLGEAQTQLELAKMDVKSLNAKLEASEAKQAEMAGKLEAAKSNFDSTFSQLRADVVEHARQYAVDISEKDKEIKSLKERGSNHRSSNRSKKSSHSQDGTQEKHRA